jgi:uncharacterized protein YuzE
MKIAYYPETDSLYIDLSEGSSVETTEISEGVHLDYDQAGNIVGIDIDGASKKLDLRTITLADFPTSTQVFQNVA